MSHRRFRVLRSGGGIVTIALRKPRKRPGALVRVLETQADEEITRLGWPARGDNVRLDWACNSAVSKGQLRFILRMRRGFRIHGMSFCKTRGQIPVSHTNSFAGTCPSHAKTARVMWRPKDGRVTILQLPQNPPSGKSCSQPCKIDPPAAREAGIK